MKVFETKILDRDIETISEVLREGQLGFGSNVLVFENYFQNFSKQEHNIALNSASAAAFLIFAYLREIYGVCDVYTPSLAFTSPAWAAKHFGHNIIWVDVDDNLLFDVEDYLKVKTPNARKAVLMPVLYGGVSTIPRLEEYFKEDRDEILVVDSAHCVTPTLKGDFTFYSFHPYKPIACSDGGMIATDNEAAAVYFRRYRNFGRVGSGDYDIGGEGFKFYMNNLNATIALTQAKRYQENLEVRKTAYSLYKQLNLPGRLLTHDESSSYYFATLIQDSNALEELSERWTTDKHYPLLHKTSYYNSRVRLENTERLHKLLLNLPLYDPDLCNSRSRS